VLRFRTYADHRWVFTDLADTCLAVVVITKDSTRLEVR
jgi:hypothetical protein